MKICFFGTYDADQPRTRVLIEGLRKAGVTVIEHRLALWANTAQKVSIAHRPAGLLGQLGRFACTYARLLGAARRLETCDAIFYPHFGQLDLIATGWLFRRRGIPLIWDALISAFDTAAGDRQLLDVRSLRARGLARLDRAAGRRADRVLADTPQNAAFWRDRFGVAPGKLRVVPVGAEDMFSGEEEPSAFISVQTAPAGGCRRQRDLRPVSREAEGTPCCEVLFFGKYIPLQGVETILRAAEQLAPHPHIHITLIGMGQERPMADGLAAALDLQNVRFVDWTPYDALPATIAAADVCLGIFGTGDKARRVVPNKAYQALAAGRPLITADTPATRDGLWRDGLAGAALVPPGDAGALAATILDLSRDPERRAALAHDARALHDRFYRSELIGRQVADIVREIRGVAGRAESDNSELGENAKAQRHSLRLGNLRLCAFASLCSAPGSPFAFRATRR